MLKPQQQKVSYSVQAHPADVECPLPPMDPESLRATFTADGVVVIDFHCGPPPEGPNGQQAVSMVVRSMGAEGAPLNHHAMFIAWTTLAGVIAANAPHSPQGQVCAAVYKEVNDARKHESLQYVGTIGGPPKGPVN